MDATSSSDAGVDVDVGADRAPKPQALSSTQQRQWHVSATPVLVGAVVVLLTFANLLIIPPLNRLLESNICREYFAEHDPSSIPPDGNVPERECKIGHVQRDLAKLIGLITTLGIVCELVVTIPLGYLSDVYGRKKILYWNICAMALAYGWVMVVGYFYKTFEINAVIAAPFIYLFGGNVNVTNANLLAIIADIAEDDVQRTKIFGYFSSAGQVVQLLSPVLAAITMTLNLWIPFWIGVVAFIIALGVVTVLPETRRQVERPHADYSSIPSLAVDRLDEEEQLIRGTSSHSSSSNKIFKFQTVLHATVTRLKNEYRDFGYLVTSSRNVGLCLVVFLVTTLAKSNLNVLLQYVSNRYDWTIAQAAYLFTLKAGVNVILYTVILPQGLKHLTSRAEYTKVAANLWGAKVSLFFLCIGVTAVALSAKIWMLFISLVVYALGWGLNLFMLSLLTHASFEILDDMHTARIYSAVGFVEAIGLAAGTPLLSYSWAAGINIGGMGLGLPFFISGIMYLVVGSAVWNLQF